MAESREARGRPSTGGTVFDDANRESVGLEPAWVEGTGGTAGGEPVAAPKGKAKAKSDEEDAG